MINLILVFSPLLIKISSIFERDLCYALKPVSIYIPNVIRVHRFVSLWRILLPYGKKRIKTNPLYSSYPRGKTAASPSRIRSIWFLHPPFPRRFSHLLHHLLRVASVQPRSIHLPRQLIQFIVGLAAVALTYLPTSSFPILEPQNPWIDKFYVVQQRRATDFKAPKLWKGSSGSAHLPNVCLCVCATHPVTAVRSWYTDNTFSLPRTCFIQSPGSSYGERVHARSSNICFACQPASQPFNRNST